MELAESIKATGLLQPIIVKPVDNRFQIIAGERRWRAHQLSGLSEIDAIIRNSDSSVVESFGRLDPCEGKLSSTVLRGERGGNTPDLPGPQLKQRQIPLRRSAP
jgi:hypothetical protein